MTEETEAPIEQPSPEQPAAGDTTTFSAEPVSPEPSVTVKMITAPEIPISWKDELKEIVQLSEDELERIFTWLKTKV